MGCIHVSPGRSNHSGVRELGHRPAGGARGHSRERLAGGVVQWLKPLVEAWGVEVLVSDDLKELDVAARRLDLGHQVCYFHILRWLRQALRDLRKQLAFKKRMHKQPDPRVALANEHHPLVDQVWQIMKERPPDGRTRLYTLWRGIDARRSRDRQTYALYRLRLLILRLHENWEKYTFDQRDATVPSTNNGTERAIGKWRLRSHRTRGFKSCMGLEGAILLCGSEIA